MHILVIILKQLNLNLICLTFEFPLVGLDVWQISHQL